MKVIDYFFTGQTAEAFHNKGILLAIMDQLNSLPNANANYSLQVFSTLPQRPSGPVAFLAFTLLTLWVLTIWKQHFLLDCRHSCSALPRTGHPRRREAALLPLVQSLTEHCSVTNYLHLSIFFDRKTIKQPVGLCFDKLKVQNNTS